MLCVCFVGCTTTTLPRRATAFSLPRRMQYSASASSSAVLYDTLYSLNDKVCPPTEEHILRRVVEKHCHTLDLYLDQRPIAPHTQEAFDIVKEFVANSATKSTTTHSEGIILDSGCGTARSSLLLGRMYPNHLVIGIDRSLARLWRNVKFRKGSNNGKDSVLVNGESKLEKGDMNGNDDDDSSIQLVDDDDDDDDKDDGKVPAVQRAADNVLLVRAELSDFWRLAYQEEWNICRHYLLYPNPYPKKSRLKSRWYAHPAFPILLGLGKGNDVVVVVRSNWKGYLEEFATCVEIANECMGFSYQAKGPTRRRKSCTTEEEAWTNFEIKYDNVGEPTYELVLSQNGKRTGTFKKCRDEFGQELV